MAKKTKREKQLDELKEVLYQLDRDGLSYIHHVAEEMAKGNDKKYHNMTKEECLTDFEEWKAQQQAVTI